METLKKFYEYEGLCIPDGASLLPVKTAVAIQSLALGKIRLAAETKGRSVRVQTDPRKYSFVMFDNRTHFEPNLIGTCEPLSDTYLGIVAVRKSRQWRLLISFLSSTWYAEGLDVTTNRRELYEFGWKEDSIKGYGIKLIKDTIATDNSFELQEKGKPLVMPHGVNSNQIKIIPGKFFDFLDPAEILFVTPFETNNIYLLYLQKRYTSKLNYKGSNPFVTSIIIEIH